MTTDLFGWCPHGTHTLVSLSGLRPMSGRDGAQLRCDLLDPDGNPLETWTEHLAHGNAVFIDSRRVQFHPDAVSLRISTVDLDEHQWRDAFGGLIDWYTTEGALASLHSDHTVVDRDESELTEIVLEPSRGRRHHLLISNGPIASQAGELRLETPETATTKSDDLAPYATTQIEITAPPTAEPVALTGRLPLRSYLCQPYVITTGDRFEAYHAGTLYPDMRPVPSPLYDLLGDGEVNPMMVLEDESATTRLHLFNSHGPVEGDFWVDLILYDCAGEIVARHPRWRCAVRNGVTTASLREALPRDMDRFVGHAALNFSRTETENYPSRLQALFQYDSPVNSARVMVWSDKWNSPLQGARPGRLLAYTRVWSNDLLRTDLSITNCGLPGLRGPYDATINAELELINTAGERLTTNIDVGPQATIYDNITSFFPDADEFVAPHGYGMVHVAATGDLAMVQVTRHQVSGALGIEHFMAAPTLADDGKYVLMAGA